MQFYCNNREGRAYGKLITAWDGHLHNTQIPIPQRSEFDDRRAVVARNYATDCGVASMLSFERRHDRSQNRDVGSTIVGVGSRSEAPLR